MTLASRLFSLPGFVIAGAAEYFMVIRLLPDYFNSHSRFTAILGIILANSAFGIIFRVFLYPNLLSPLRRIRGPRVSEKLDRIRPRRKCSLSSL